jgi:hypothetical protein
MLATKLEVLKASIPQMSPEAPFRIGGVAAKFAPLVEAIRHGGRIYTILEDWEHPHPNPLPTGRGDPGCALTEHSQRGSL